MKTLLSSQALASALAKSDLTEPGARPHAIHLTSQAILNGLADRGWPTAQIQRGPRVVSAKDNYGLLGYAEHEITLGSDHTRWVSDSTLLRTQTTSLIPSALQEAATLRQPGQLILIAAPGITYRRDERDRLHCAEPHQMDIWILGDPSLASSESLLRLVTDVLDAAVPGQPWTSQSSPHHYTESGIEIHATRPEGPVEVLECGLIAKSLLSRLGVDSALHGGLALGMGLDRLTMLRKGIPDIRLLRDNDERIDAQMRDLKPWRPVSKQPATLRDLSLAVDPGHSLEELTERALKAAGEKHHWIEAVELRGRWPYSEVPEQARERLGLLPGQENVLLRVALRDWANSIPKEDGNALYAALQKALHQGEPGGGYKL